MAATTESRFLMSAREILADISGLLPHAEANPVVAGDLQERVAALLRLVDETMPVGSQLDPFEPTPARAFVPAMSPPSLDD